MKSTNKIGIARARIIYRYVSILAFLVMLWTLLHTPVWLKVTLTTCILLPLTVNAIRSYRFYQRNIKHGQHYN